MAHTYLLTHALFSTRDPKPCLDAELKPELFSYMGGIISHLKGRPVLIVSRRPCALIVRAAPYPVSLRSDGKAQSELLQVGARTMAPPQPFCVAERLYGVQRQLIQP